MSINLCRLPSSKSVSESCMACLSSFNVCSNFSARSVTFIAPFQSKLGAAFAAPVFAFSVRKQRKRYLSEPVIGDKRASVTVESEEDASIFSFALSDCRNVAASRTLGERNAVEFRRFNPKATKATRNFARCDSATLDCDSGSFFLASWARKV